MLLCFLCLYQADHEHYRARQPGVSGRGGDGCETLGDEISLFYIAFTTLQIRRIKKKFTASQPVAIMRRISLVDPMQQL